MNSPLLDKSLDFSTQIVLFYEEFSKGKKAGAGPHRYSGLFLSFNRFRRARFGVISYILKKILQLQNNCFVQQQA